MRHMPRTLLISSCSLSLLRHFRTSCIKNKGAVLGVYQPKEKDGEFILSKAAQHMDQRTSGKLSKILKIASRKLKAGGSRVLYDIDENYSSVALCCIGKQGQGFNELEGFEEGRENIRAAISGGVQSLRGIGEVDVAIDPCGDAEAAAEGSYLGLFEYDELKDKEKRKPKMTVQCYTDHMRDSHETEELWRRGMVQAEGQNWARLLMEAPANIITPQTFAERVSEKLGKLDCSVIVRDKAWIESHDMGAFLSVAQGSVVPPVFLEIDYQGTDSESPVALVGKGITFDSGGISLKPSAGMDQMRADMGGAACTVGALYSVAKQKLPIYVKGFIPLCENMPSGTATKPGDVVKAKNGKTIQVDNTDAEGRLILADALCYAETFNPRLILDMATLTGAIDVALGSGASGVFTNSTDMWNLLEKAGSRTGDRVWRMPLFKHYTKQVTPSKLADLSNIGKIARSGGSCTAAAFLREFVTIKHWLHLDIAGVMSNKNEVPYLSSGMAGMCAKDTFRYS